MRRSEMVQVETEPQIYSFILLLRFSSAGICSEGTHFSR